MTSNSKTFKTQFGFQELSRAWIKGTFFLNHFQEPVDSVKKVAKLHRHVQNEY